MQLKFAATLFCLIALLGFAVSATTLQSTPSKPRTDPSGVYEGTVSFKKGSGFSALEFTLEALPSSVPGQMTVTGQARHGGEFGGTVEVRGTYYVNTGRLKAFGEVRGNEDRYTVTLDGTRHINSDEFFVRCTIKENESGAEAASEFYLVHGSRSTEGAKLELTLLPSTATPGQFLEGKALIEVTNATGPVSIRFSGHVAYRDGVKSLHTSLSRQGVQDTVDGNGKYELDIKRLGMVMPAGVEDPKLVLVARAGSSSITQSIRLEYTESGNPILLTVKTVKAPDRITLGTSFRISVFYSAHSETMFGKVQLTERASLMPIGGTKTEFARGTWDAEIKARSETERDGEGATFECVPTAVGKYRVEFEITGQGVQRTIGLVDFEVVPPAGSTPMRKGDIKGTLQMETGSIETTEATMLTFGYSMSGRSFAEAQEVVELVGPAGTVVGTSTKTRTLNENEQVVRKWMVNGAEAGMYKIRARVTGEDIQPFRYETELRVTEKKKQGTGGAAGQTKPPAVQGTYGLVKIEGGKVTGDGVDPYGTWSGTLFQGGCQVTWTATRDYKGTYTFQSSMKAPPSVLKQGEILELTCTASASRTSENQPSHGSAARWFVEGAEVIESTPAFAGSASDGKFYSSGSGKTKFKVGGGGTIRIIQGHGQNWSHSYDPFVYVYQWNTPPDPTLGQDKPVDDDQVVNTKTGLTPLTPDDEEEAKLSAFLSQSEITLEPGGMSQIVNVHISGFRTRTEDRVEVVFPEQTDGWASLPNNLVVMGGSGSYWPPNMSRPEHVDGYFFRARSTAVAGTYTVNIVVRQKKAGEVRLKLTVRVVGKGKAPITPPVSSGGNWQGTWTSNFDDLLLTQNGDKVTGKFGVQEFRIDGTVKGRVFTFKVYDGQDFVGNASLTMSEDGTSFKGELVLGDDEKLEWTGKRKN